MILDQIPKIKSLSQEQKLTLVGELWDEIVHNEYPDVSEEEKMILNERYQSYKSNPRKGTSWQEVKKQLQNQ